MYLLHLTITLNKTGALWAKKINKIIIVILLGLDFMQATYIVPFKDSLFSKC